MGKRHRRPVAAATPARRRKPGDSSPAPPAPLLVAGGRGGGAPAAAVEAARSRLALPAERRRTVQAEESAFAKLGADRLEQLALLSTYAPLERPVRPERACFAPQRLEPPPGEGDADADAAEHALRVPKRPRWHTDLDKKTVEANEAEVFRQWLVQTDAAVAGGFARVLPPPPPNRSELFAAEMLESRPSPGTAVIGSLYERNVEVFRQLWRVCERSDILCVLLDARCPPLHLPPALVAYLQRFGRLRTLLVLTKADLVPAPIVAAWKAWLQRTYQWRVVATESYQKQERLEGQGQRIRHVPYLAPASRTALFSALHDVHQDLVTPPASVASDPQRLADWQPGCLADVDWRGLEAAAARMANGGTPDEAPDMADAKSQGDAKAASHHAPTLDRQGPSRAKKWVTVGLIGQPNVGKSSLLNALFGAKVVRASKTPGKTKHFQTHFIGRTLQLQDSPGLVFPSFAGMETQVLGAILPISQVQAVSTCVAWAAAHLPLERMLQLELPSNDSSAPLQPGEARPEEWTATRILEALARRHNYKTAKAGRWDLNRAGNGLMRSLAEGRVPWAFRPPMADDSISPGCIGDAELDARVLAGDGIWLGMPQAPADADAHDDASEDEEEEDDAAAAPSSGQDEQQTRATRSVRFGPGTKAPAPEGARAAPQAHAKEEESEEESEEDAAVAASGGMFAALALDGGDSSSEASASDSDADESDSEPDDDAAAAGK